MRIAMFSIKRYEPDFFEPAAAKAGHEILPLEAPASAATASLARGCGAVCVFVNDRLDAPALRALRDGGVGLLALRSAGFNHVDVREAHALGLAVARVPAYSPHAVAEHAVALLMAVNRRTHRAYNRVREHDFSIDGLMGVDLHGKVVGCVGTGKIGRCFCAIMRGFGCEVIASDPFPSQAAVDMGVKYVPIDELLRRSDVVALHCPLTPATRHLIDEKALASMKPGAILINTSRGGVVDTRALIGALKQGRLGGVGLDVYEEEADLFFRDLSERPILDDVFARLLTFPTVLVTAHQAFFTREAMLAIAQTTIDNVTAFAKGGAGAIPPANLVTPALLA